MKWTAIGADAGGLGAAGDADVHTIALVNLAPATFGLDGWPEKIALIGVVVAITIVAFAVIGLVARRLTRRAGAIADPGKWQQRRTATTLLATMLRYLALVAAIVVIISILAGGGSIGALGGSAIVAVTIGLASQRLLTDIIAGFFILFEGQYAVGDTIAVEPSKIIGVVEELGVRTTLVRESNGNRSYIPNGEITAVRRFPGPDTTLVVTAITRDPDATTAAFRDLGRMSTPTHGVLGSIGGIEQEPIANGLTVVRARIGAASMLSDTASVLIAQTLTALGGDAIIGAPSIVALAPAEELPRATARV